MNMGSRREALEAAFDKEEGTEDEPVNQQNNEEVAEGTELQTEGEGHLETGAEPKAPDEGGKKDLKGEKPPKEESVDEKERKAAAKIAEQSQRPTERSEPIQTKAPNSWPPALREKWTQIPADVRATVLKRETEIQKTLSETDNIRKFSQDLAQVLTPHIPFIQASGTNPLGAIAGLMDTASKLYGGNVDTKASVVAQLIWRYGVDIKTLDHILANKKMPNGTPFNDQATGRGPEAPPAWAQPIFNFMTEAQQARAQATQREMEAAQAEIAPAQEWPFFEDVRETVADLMEAAYNRGRVLTLKQAYERAIAVDPDISKVVEQRKLAARQQSGNVARARRAASSIKGSPAGGVGGANKPKTRRDQIAEAWDTAES